MNTLVNILGILPAELSRFEYLIPRLEELLSVALILAVSFGFIFSVYLGVKLATSEDSNKRQASKKHIIVFICSMVLIVFLIYLIRSLVNIAQGMV